VSDKIPIELDEALAWARGERRLEVYLPDGSWSEMSVRQYQEACETQERLQAHRGRSELQLALLDQGT
jgi:hypothetical protein